MKHLLALTVAWAAVPAGAARADGGAGAPVQVADGAAAPVQIADDAGEPVQLSDGAGEPSLEVTGYGELSFAFHDYAADQTGPSGAEPDRRLVFDTARLVVKLEREIVDDVEVEAEIEIEHGGTGAELEQEFEEFGEFEQEVEKGGEVVVEELYLEWEALPWLSVKAGRFYVAVGLLSSLYRPTDYLGATRPEGETRVVPAVWDEQGAAVEMRLGDAELTVQLVSGLDSSGFSSQQWVARGHQARFELTRATGLAVVGRVDWSALPGLVAGASSYFGDTAANRPKPDMEGTRAPLYIGDLHATYDGHGVRARAVALWGRLFESAVISDKNSRLSNNLGVLRTPVASQGLAAWAEVGVDVAGALGLSDRHRLEPFIRVERYDTMFRTDAEIFDNPRFARTIAAAGVAHTVSDRLVSTFEVSHRRLGSAELNNENTACIALGFVY
jgi:hypothetical protein